MALANYYEDLGGEAVDLAFAGESAVARKKDEITEGGPVETIELDSDAEDDSTTAKPLDDSDPLASEAPSSGDSKPKTRSRFATMASIRADESSSDDEDAQTYYAGGSENSGQQVVGPARQPNQLITDLFRSLRQHGSVETSDPTTGMRYFSGHGYRLGQSADDTQVISPASSVSQSTMRRPREVVLRLWRDGFSLDDGPLRLYTDPNEREFLSRIRQGSVPAELLPNIDGDSVSMSLEDHRHEYYKASTVAKFARPFSGQGHVLGSTMTSTTEGTEEVVETSVVCMNYPPFEIDNNQPTTVVQVRLPDGTRIKITLNTGHTIAQLRAAIVAERPEFSGRNFRLITFPNQELQDDNLTVKEADLLNSCLLLQY